MREPIQPLRCLNKNVPLGATWDTLWVQEINQNIRNMFPKSITKSLKKLQKIIKISSNFDENGPLGATWATWWSRCAPRASQNHLFIDFGVLFGLPFGTQNRLKVVMFLHNFWCVYGCAFLWSRASVLKGFGLHFWYFFSTFDQECQHWVGEVNTISNSRLSPPRISLFSHCSLRCFLYVFLPPFFIVFWRFWVPLGDLWARFGTLFWH